MPRHALLLALLIVAGCAPERPQLRPGIPIEPERPSANLQADLRPHNWGGGSCVHASLIYQLGWVEELELARAWRGTYSGGETASGIRSKLDAAGVPYTDTTTADPAFLDWCHRTRRAALIWYFPNHCVAFCGWDTVDGEVVAVLNDNNRPERFLAVPRSTFLPRWREYGGFGLSVLYSPTAPIPWPAFLPIESE